MTPCHATVAKAIPVGLCALFFCWTKVPFKAWAGCCEKYGTCDVFDNRGTGILKLLNTWDLETHGAKSSQHFTCYFNMFCFPEI